MNDYLLNQIYLEMKYHQTRHDELLRQSRNTILIQSIQPHYPSMWDTTLFNTGNLLVSLGEKLRRKRGFLRLSENCR